MKRVAWAAAGFLLAFAVLLGIRMEIPQRLFRATPGDSQVPVTGIGETETWMNLFLKDRKIGYTHSVVRRRPVGYRLEDALMMRMNLMGLAQDVRMQTAADLSADLSLERFEFSLHSGRIGLNATGRLTEDNVLVIETDLSGTPQTTRIQLAQRPHLAGTLVRAAAEGFWESGTDRFTFQLFDPATMSEAPVAVRAAGAERISVLGRPTDAVRLILRFRGADQTVWVDRKGEIVREEGLLGMRLEKTTREIATAGSSLQTAQDITRIASLPSRGTIDAPRQTAFLKLAVTGIEPGGLALDGGRQSLQGSILTIRQENIAEAATPGPGPAEPETAPFLAPEPFIQSDHPAVVSRARAIAADGTPPVAAARAIVKWVFENIRKRPVISVPDALTTLENQVGDCNEHAVLVAALARAAGIPAAIETGLVYLDGRFYYHAWNALYIGRWVTADAVFGQMPADATHIRLARGGPDTALDLMAVIGRIGIRVIDYRVSIGPKE